MSYSIFVRFSSSLSASKINGQIQLDQDILHSEYHGCVMNLTIQDSGRTLSALTFLRSISEIEKIQVRDDDDWECEEVDLLNAVSYTHLRAHETPEHLV